MFREETTSDLDGLHAAPNILVELEFGDVSFCGGRKTKGKPEKNPRSKGRTNNKLNRHMATGWNRTRATLVKGKRSHQSPVPVPNEDLLNGES